MSLCLGIFKIYFYQNWKWMFEKRVLIRQQNLSFFFRTKIDKILTYFITENFEISQFKIKFRKRLLDRKKCPNCTKILNFIEGACHFDSL